MSLAKRNEKVRTEQKRLMAQFSDIPPNKKSLAHGLIVQAARLRVALNEMWEDISEKGYYTLFKQSEQQDPYERERPVAKLYNAQETSYQRIIKQLIDLLPDEKKEEVEKKQVEGSDLL